jgi:hypothetical protein
MGLERKSFFNNHLFNIEEPRTNKYVLYGGSEVKGYVSLCFFGVKASNIYVQYPQRMLLALSRQSLALSLALLIHLYKYILLMKYICIILHLFSLNQG